MKRFPLLIALPLFAVTMSAQSPTPSDGRDVKFEDPLLDKLVGNWRVVRKFGDGRTAENTVRVVWVLNHQFPEFHYLVVATPHQYEATAFIGFDHNMTHYVFHRLYIFARRTSAVTAYG